MERDSTFDSGLLYPCAKRIVDHRAFECLEHETLTTLSAEGESFLTDGQGGFLICFLGADTHDVAVLGFDDMFPTELLDVADAKTGHAGEQRNLTQNLMLAGGGRQFLDLFKSQELNLCVFPFYLVKIVVDVLAE